MDKKLPITAFDMLTISQTMQLFKAALPFLDYELQKLVSMFIRINELKQTMNFYSCPKNYNTIKSCCPGPSLGLNSSLEDIVQNEALINAVLPYCPESYSSIIKNYQQFSKMSDVFSCFNGSGADGAFTPGDGGMADMFNMFSKMSSAANDNKDMSSSSNPFEKNQDSDCTTKEDNNEILQSVLNNFLKPEQQAMYNEYLKQLDALDKTDAVNKSLEPDKEDTMD